MLLTITSLAAAGFTLAALFIIDLRSQRLPDPLTLLFGLLGLGYHALHQFDLAPLTALLAGATLGALLTLIGMVLAGLLRQRRPGRLSLAWPGRDTRIPFGPGLILATVIVFLGTVFAVPA